jgi:hypothetical protein
MRARVVLVYIEKIMGRKVFDAVSTKTPSSVTANPQDEVDIMRIRHRICQIELAGSSHPIPTCSPILVMCTVASRYGSGGGEGNSIPNEVDNKFELVDPFSPRFADPGGRIAIVPFRETESVT